MHLLSCQAATWASPASRQQLLLCLRSAGGQFACARRPETAQLSSTQQLLRNNAVTAATTASTSQSTLLPALRNAAAHCACSGSAHVPLQQYSSHLRNITQQLQAAGVQQVVLLTPPPVNDAAPDAVKPGEVRRMTDSVDRGFASCM